MANDFTHSLEYSQHLAGEAYQRFLGRPADSGGLAYWANQLQNGARDEDLEARFTSSPEYVAKHGGAGGAWVQQLYQDILGRPADPNGVGYWVQRLSAGESPLAVAMSFAYSAERESNVVLNDYQIFLNRSADPAGLNYWVGKLPNGATDEDLAAGFLASPEYIAGPTHGNNDPGQWVQNLYLTVLGRFPSNDDLAYWTNFLDDQVETQAPVYITDNQGDLFTVNVQTGTTNYIGNMGTTMWDLAMGDSGTLYAADPGSTLYQIDPTSARRIDSVAVYTANGQGVQGINALEFRGDNVLFGASGNHLYTIDPASGLATEVGNGILGSEQSSGDIAFDISGNIYVSTQSGSLVEVKVDFSSSQVVATGLPQDLYGLVVGQSGTIYGFSNSEQAIVKINIDGDSGAVSVSPGAALQDASGALRGVYGATMSPVAALENLAAAQAGGSKTILLTGGVTTSVISGGSIVQAGGTVQTAQDLARFVFAGYTNHPIGIAQLTNLPNTYLLTISGTQFLPGQASGLAEDFSSNAGLDDDFRDNLVAALLAHVPTGANVIVAGHSLGGMEAQNLVNDPRVAQYRFTNVVTFGSPYTATTPASGTTYVRFADAFDIVPVLSFVNPFPSLGGQILLDGAPPVQGQPLSLDQLIAPHMVYPQVPQLLNYDALGNPITAGNPGVQLQFDQITYYPDPSH